MSIKNVSYVHYFWTYNTMKKMTLKGIHNIQAQGLAELTGEQRSKRQDHCYKDLTARYLLSIGGHPKYSPTTRKGVVFSAEYSDRATSKTYIAS